MSQGKFDSYDTARKWAYDFAKSVKENPIIAFDEECMVSWFVKAIHEGYEAGHKNAKEKYNGKSA